MANITTRFHAESNVPEVVEEDAKALKKRSRELQNAQERIAAIIARGDPLKELEVQQARELRLLERAAGKHRALREDLEKAKAKIVADYAAKRQAILDREAKEQTATAERLAASERKAADATMALGTRVGKLKQPLSEAGALVGALGGQLGGSTGAAARFGAALSGTFAVGGPLLLGLAAAGTGIAAIVDHVRTAEQTAAKERFLGLDPALLDRLTAKFPELERSSVVALAAAGKEANLTEGEIVHLGRVAREEAEMSGQAFDDSLTAALGRVGTAAAEARRALRSMEFRNVDKGAESSVASLEKLADTMKAYEEQRQRQAEAQRRMTELTRPFGGGEIPEVFAEQRRQFEAARAEAERAKEAADALFTSYEQMLEARDKAQDEDALFNPPKDKNKRPGREELPTTPFGADLAAERARAAEAESLDRQFAGEAVADAKKLGRDVAVALEEQLAAADPFRQIDLQLKRQMARIDELRKEAQELLKNPETADSAQSSIDQLTELEQAARDAAARKRDELEAQRIEEQNRRANEMIKRAKEESLEDDKEEQAKERAQMAGASWAVNFASGFAQSLKEGDAAGIIQSILQGLATGLAMYIGGAPGILVGGGIGILGGLFEKGGPAFGLHMAQGRNGLATLPGLNYDAKPSWLHEEEVVMPKDVVRGTFGGLPEAVRVAAGGPLPGGGGPVYLQPTYVMALDQESFRRTSGRVLEPTLVARFDDRQASRFRAGIRRAVSGLESGR